MLNVITLVVIGYLFVNSNGKSYENIFSIYTKFVSNIPQHSENVSAKCVHHLNIYSQYFKNRTEWALKMFYASGIQPSEIFQGSTSSFGNYDQCLRLYQVVEKDVITGKYCLADFLLTNKDHEDQERNETFRSGLCFPGACSAIEMQDILTNLSEGIEVKERFCNSYEEVYGLDIADISVLVLLVGILVLVIVSTWCHVKYGNETIVCSAFSLKNNVAKCLATTTNVTRNTISCLEGIRVLSLMWIITRHVFNKHLLVRSLRDEILHTVIVSGTLAVDTFFVMSGLLLCYNEMKRKSTPLNPWRYAARILRLVPVLAVVVFFHMSLMRHVDDGPLWKLTKLNDSCNSYWWSTLLFIQNYVNHENMCVLASWYLCADMQLFLLSPILLVLLQRKPFWGMLLAVTFLGLLIAIPFALPWIYDGNSLKQIIITQKYQTHMRATPWFIGFILGYIIHISKTKKPKLNQVISRILWLISLTVIIAAIIFGVHARGYTSKFRFENAVRLGLLHPLWALAISWVIYACTFGYGGVINTFLSLPIFQILSKFSYAAYLVHSELVYIAQARNRMAQSEILTETVLKTNGTMFETLYISIILTLCVEMPFLTISQLIKHK